MNEPFVLGREWTIGIGENMPPSYEKRPKKAKASPAPAEYVTLAKRLMPDVDLRFSVTAVMRAKGYTTNQLCDLFAVANLTIYARLEKCARQLVDDIGAVSNVLDALPALKDVGCFMKVVKRGF